MEISNYEPSLSSVSIHPRITLIEDKKTSAILITAEGPRVILSTFVGDYKNQLTSIFGEMLKGVQNELEDMREIFGSEKSRENYFDQKPQTDQQIKNRINFNAKRAIDGNPFTGFAAIEKTTEKIIGFVSLGRGYEAGESQSGLIINPDVCGMEYGREIAALAGSLALVYAQNQFKVGSLKRGMAPVWRFTATVLDAHKKGIEFIQNLGMTFIRPLTEQESSSPRSLYGVTIKELNHLLEEKMGIKEIDYEYRLIEG